VKLEVTVAAAIGWLKVALTPVLVATPVTAGELAAGDVALTVGWVPTVGAPRIGSMPLPQAASIRVSSAAVQPRSEPSEWEEVVMTVCALMVLADARERIEGSRG
jgi:hypothetical protein